MKRTTFMAAVFALAASIALAQDATQSAVDQFQADGYTRIEVKVGPTQTKIEAIRGDTKVEVVIDKATGAVLKREVETVRPGENTTPGVFIDSRDDDFVDGDDDDGEDDDGDDGDDDDSDDDDDDDNSGSGDDDDDDDNSGSGGGHSGSGSDDD